MDYGHYYNSVSVVTDSAQQAIKDTIRAALPKLPTRPFMMVEDHPHRGDPLVLDLDSGPFLNMYGPTDSTGEKKWIKQDGSNLFWNDWSGSEVLVMCNNIGSSDEDRFQITFKQQGSDAKYERKRCRTDQAPMDFLVCVCLIVMEHFSPGHHRISSDGSVEDWRPALEFVRRELLGDYVVLPVNVDPDRVTRNEQYGAGPKRYVEEPLTVFRNDAESQTPSLYF